MIEDIEVGKYIIIKEGQEVWLDLISDVKAVDIIGLPMKITEIKCDVGYTSVHTKYGEWVLDEIEVVFEDWQVEYWL